MLDDLSVGPVTASMGFKVPDECCFQLTVISTQDTSILRTDSVSSKKKWITEIQKAINVLSNKIGCVFCEFLSKTNV